MPPESTTPRRCTTCKEWGKASTDGYCKHCAALWEPAPLEGLPRGGA